MREKAVAFIVVRLSSSRFPAKQFKKIGDRTILQWNMARLRSCVHLDQIVIATVAEVENKPLLGFAEKEDVPCFWYDGDVDHVTTRLRKAAEFFAADLCILVSGDCPLIHGPILDQMILTMRQAPNADHVIVIPEVHGEKPAIEGVLVARKRAWQLADDLSDRPELKEHQFPVIKQHPELFVSAACTIPRRYCSSVRRLSVDTWADLEFMNAVHDELICKGAAFDLPEVLKLLEEKPGLTQINAHVHQRGLVEDVKKILIIIDAGREFGYGHLMRSLEIALRLTESFGYPVTFIVDDVKAAQLLHEHGLRVIWGALCRPAFNPPDDHGLPVFRGVPPPSDLFIIDIYGPRQLPPRWRDQLKINCPVLVLDHADGWALKGDLIIIPGVTLPQAKSRPGVLTGLEYVILRRDIKRLQTQSGRAKDLDILAYIHSEERREVFEAFALRHQLRVSCPSSFNNSFHELMARARFFLADFGYSFYEALALGAFPVVWPGTVSHRKDAALFYRRMGLDAVIIDNAEMLKTILLPLVSTMDKPPAVDVMDGTALIVGAVKTLLERS